MEHIVVDTATPYSPFQIAYSKSDAFPSSAHTSVTMYQLI
jgi:hypothetical protein